MSAQERDDYIKRVLAEARGQQQGGGSNSYTTTTYTNVVDGNNV